MVSNSDRRAQALTLVFLLLAGAPLEGARAQTALDTTLSLTSRVFDNTRDLRVLLPPGYHDPVNATRRYPVFYFTDGVAAWHGWGVPEAARRLWREGAIPPYIFVGIDNGGSALESTDPARDRASEYLPYPDPSWTEDPPEPRGQSFPAFLFDEVMPLIAEVFRADHDPSVTGLAGDSYDGAVALYTGIRYPERLGLLLIEDAARAGNWPGMIYLGVGTAEGDTPEVKRRMVDTVEELAVVLRQKATDSKIGLLVVDGAVHWYDDWKARLPQALLFLLGGAPLEP